MEFDDPLVHVFDAVGGEVKAELGEGGGVLEFEDGGNLRGETAGGTVGGVVGGWEKWDGAKVQGFRGESMRVRRGNDGGGRARSRGEEFDV